MTRNGRSCSFIIVVLLAAALTAAAQDPLACWRNNVKIAPVAGPDHHSIHAYFNSCPESPDGRWVLYYASNTADGQNGEIRILERATGKVKVLARNVETEDAHRAACQQWVSKGARVVFHNRLKSGAWAVMCVDVESERERVLAPGRMVGFGQPHGDLVPIYGPHWNPGSHSDFELVNVVTGTIAKASLTAEAVKKAYPEWVKKQFGEGPVSIYIPMLSPDLKRVFFKLATPKGGDFRSSQASLREGLICYDLAQDKLLSMRERWGHPAWHPDSRHIINVPGIVIDSDTGKSEPIPKCPKLPGSHPSYSPDGKLFTSDTLAGPFGGPDRWWAIGAGDVRTGEFVLLHKFDNSKGAQSWRVSHPHPVFSADGGRLYFNVSADGWTRLYVAQTNPEQKKAPAPKTAKNPFKDRYPLPYPPTLPGGKTVVTESTPDFLKQGPNLREGVEIAKAIPTVDFAFYPEQNYPGNPWSHRSDGIVVGDKYYSSSNDHLAPRGTAHLWEYDGAAKKFRHLCDTSKFLESVSAFPADMNYRPGEMQSRIDLGGAD